MTYTSGAVNLSKKIVYSKPSNYGLKNYCAALSGPPLGLNDYSHIYTLPDSVNETQAPNDT